MLNDYFLYVVDLDVWYFDGDATKHITLHHNFFTSLQFAPIGNLVSCANNFSYLVKRVGQIVLIATDGSTLTLLDALYVLGIKKNLLLFFALAKIGLIIKFMDDRCMIHVLSFSGSIIASSWLCCGIYKLNCYGDCVKDVACTMDL